MDAHGCLEVSELIRNLFLKKRKRLLGRVVETASHLPISILHFFQNNSNFSWT